MKIIKALSAILAICSLSSVCYADFEGVKVYVDNQLVEYDTQPVNINDRLLVPMRATFNALGADVEWIGELQTVISTSGSILIVLQVNNSIMIFTDADTGETKTITLDTPPIISNDRTMVPLRAISEVFNYSVDWDEENQSVAINKYF